MLAKKNHQPVICALLIGLSSLSCGPEAPLFSDSFLGLVSGGQVPIAPGPDTGYIMVFVTNSTGQSIEWVVTAETEEIVVALDGNGGVVGFDPARTLEPETVDLLTDVDANTLAIVFSNSPVEFAPVGPGELTFALIQDAVNQLIAKDPERFLDRPFIRLLRVLRIGLGPSLNVPASQDEGLIVRPAGSDPDANAGSIFPSEVNNALSFDQGNFAADFGNGDMVIFLATTSATAVGGIRVVAGVVDGEEANGEGGFSRDTFRILREAEGPISPPPPE
jgi:hypothetical protein